MSHARIPVDLYNPGQVFACLGLAEMADALVGGARGGFDWSDPAKTWFDLSVPGDEHPVRAALRFLQSASVSSVAPVAIEALRTEKWQVETKLLGVGQPFPFAAPDSPASLPALLTVNAVTIRIEHWGDSTERDNVKFWAGAGGYPGVALLRDALAAAGSLAGATDDPFAHAAPMSSSFRFDWRRDYVPLGIGFSLNEHGKMSPQGYPLVEVLAAIGLTHARPARPDRRDKLVYRYGVLGGSDRALPLLRVALGCPPLPLPLRCFRAQLSWPGKENQSRCITHVLEETPA
jgi:CRISPR-associated protein Csb3